MNVLVTGSNGFLGSTLVRRLLETTEHVVRCLVRPGSDSGGLTTLEERFSDRMEIYRGTLSNPNNCRAALENIERVYHLAAGLSGPAVELFTNGSVATRNLLQAMTSSEPTPGVVFCSSFGVYGVADLERCALVDEQTPLETRPQDRDLYSYAKLHQEQLVQEYQAKCGFDLAVLRPGVIYGPGGPAISGRVGVNLFGLYLRLGGNNALPLTYVDNCADAFVAVGEQLGQLDHRVFNVVDDDVLTAKQFLQRYRKAVKAVPYVPIPYPVMRILSGWVSGYSRWSKGQLPAIFSRYKTASIWKGNRFTNERLKGAGWTQQVTTAQGLDRHFAALSGAQ